MASWKSLNSKPGTASSDSHNDVEPRRSSGSDEYTGTSSPPQDPHSPTVNSPFLPESPTSVGAAPSNIASSSAVVTPRTNSTLRSMSNPSANSQFVSSPLNPTAPPTGQPLSAGSSFSRSRPGSMHLADYSGDRYSIAGLGARPGSGFMTPGSTLNNRGSMVLYRLATEDEHGALLPPARRSGMNRDSVASSSGDSIMSMGDDLKYPNPKYASGLATMGYGTSQRGLVPYAYDPDFDEKEPLDEEDLLHDPDDHTPHKRTMAFPVRGFFNIGVLLLLIGALLTLFMGYPLISYFETNARNARLANTVSLGTPAAESLTNFPQMVDPETPQDKLTRTGLDGEPYTLVFSDEFNTDGRTFFPGDDPYWTAVDLEYWVTNDTEWYDPKQITTKDGKLVITMDKIPDDDPNGVRGWIPNVVDPNSAESVNGQPIVNHGKQYISGMLQSWNQMCFSGGYIEMSVTLPGPNADTKGYWPGAWTMGNLGRPGYAATTQGTWPYTYNSCDVGTFPNQTLKDQSGPAAALTSTKSKKKYDFKLSVLPGQRVSACTCEGEDHPGPSHNVGRGVPEIDILEAERDKEYTNGVQNLGQVASQSAQFAPFNADYIYPNATAEEWEVYDTTLVRPNSYKGSPIQQAVSVLSHLPEDMFQGSGANPAVMGFEYFSDAKKPDDGFITFVADGKATARMGAGAVGPDSLSEIGQRLIPVEPMSIIINLGMATNWQAILLETMIFPAVMTIDYVRVYQRKDAINVGCSPPDFPTAEYIASHSDAYNNMNITSWDYAWPKNSLYDGC